MALWDYISEALGDIVGRESNRDILLSIRSRLATQSRDIGYLTSSLETMHTHVHEIRNQLETLGGIMAATQDQVDALTAQVTEFAGSLGTILDNIQNDLDTVKAQNPSVDLSALETSLGALTPLAERAQAIADETPEAGSEDPGDGGPVDGFSGR